MVPDILYQAGGLSAQPGQRLPLMFRVVRATLARTYLGQHRDNEAVMRYLADNATDIQWVVHRASIRNDGPSKEVLKRSTRRAGIAPFQDIAAYNLRLLTDDTAVYTCDLSAYAGT